MILLVSRNQDHFMEIPKQNINYHMSDCLGKFSHFIQYLLHSRFLCQLTCQSADIMSSLRRGRTRPREQLLLQKTTRPRDMLFFLKDTLSIEDENLFKACKSVCSSVC